MKKWFIFFLLSTFLLTSVLGYLIFYSLKIRTQNERIYTFLIDTHSSSQERTALHVLFYYYPENFFLIYYLPKKLSIPHPNKRLRETTPTLPIYTLKERELKKALEKFYGIAPDFTFTATPSNAENLIETLGGTPFFNLYSEELPKGIVYIDPFNYTSFLNSITNVEHINETAISIWYTLLKNYLIKSASQPSLQNQFISGLTALPSNLNKQTLKKLLSPLFSKEGQIYFYALRSNLTQKTLGNQTVYLPLENGEYDKQKIAEKLIAFKERQIIYEQFPITMQIKNTTSIKRFAARTAGVLRIKKIDVKEYLNSSIKLNNSVILDFSHSPIKADYVKKITQVDHIFSLFDYRENIDFSLYIANDYYGIQYLKNR